MFFHHDYSTPGPGIEKDAPEKTGPARFAEILSLECVTLLKLNLLFLLCCLPVVTIPPAVYALNFLVRKMVLDQPILFFYDFRTAFRKGLAVSYGAFALTALPLVLSGFGAAFYLGRAGESVLFFLPFLFCSTVFLVTLLASCYFYGILTCGRTPREALRLSLVLGIAKPFRGLLAALAVFGSLTAAVLEFPISAVYLLFIGFSVPCLLGQFFIRTVLRQFHLTMEPEYGEEDSGEPEARFPEE